MSRSWGSAPSWSSAVAHTWACTRSTSAQAGGSASGPSPRACAAITSSARSTFSRATRRSISSSGPATASTPSAPICPSRSAARRAGSRAGRSSPVIMSQTGATARCARSSRAAVCDEQRVSRWMSSFRLWQPSRVVNRSSVTRLPRPLGEFGDPVDQHTLDQSRDVAGDRDRGRQIRIRRVVEQVRIAHPADRFATCVRRSERGSTGLFIPSFCRGPPTFHPRSEGQNRWIRESDSDRFATLPRVEREGVASGRLRRRQATTYVTISRGPSLLTAPAAPPAPRPCARAAPPRPGSRPGRGR